MWILVAVGAASLAVLGASLVLPWLEELSWAAGTGSFDLAAAALALADPYPFGVGQLLAAAQRGGQVHGFRFGDVGCVLGCLSAGVQVPQDRAVVGRSRGLGPSTAIRHDVPTSRL
ncbi:hypothetical protein A6A08_21950 [Nocardiopsis sp. TSRI0078]|nr:hypothetical protein A6A08_21950 [Nocardiopsis sp. TSRI0078]